MAKKKYRLILGFVHTMLDSYFWLAIRYIVWTSIQYVTLHLRDRRGAASLRHRNRGATTVFVCEQKPYPVWFSWQRKSLTGIV